MIWALVAASAVYWLLGLWSRGPVAPSYTVPIADATTMRGELTRLLGMPPAAVQAAAAPPPEAASRFKLIGIVAPRAGSVDAGGVAVIAIGDKPARPYRVGASLDGQYVLRSVSLRSASIVPAQAANGAGGFTLDLPPPALAATGTLPPVSFDDSTPMAPAAHVPPPMPEIPMPADVPVQDMPPPMESDAVPQQADEPLPELPEGEAPDGTPPPGDSMRPID